MKARLRAAKWLRSKFFVFLASFLAVAVLIPALPSVSATAHPTTQVQFVEPAWVAEHSNDSNLRILDVRINPFDYFVGHIPNAVHVADNTFRGPNGALPVQYWQSDKLQSLFTEAGVTDDKQVVIYSDGADVLGATMVAYLLERSGHPNVAVVNGGFAGYKAAELPVSREFPTYSQGHFSIQENSDTRVSLAEVKNLIGNPNVIFIDPRPPAVFAGEQEIWARNGHIPGAKNIPWPTFTVGETNFHQLKPLDEIRALLARRGIEPTDNIIVTCSTGREATLQYNVLKHVLGYPNVRVYEGSWTEYSSHPDLPIETGRDPHA